MTVRRAMNLLADKGIVYATKGRGTFVKPLELQSINFSLDGFISLFQDESQAQVRILRAGIARASDDVAEKLDIKPGDRTVHITSLISSQKEPIVYHWEYLIYDASRPIVEAEIEITSLHGLFSGSEEAQLNSGEMCLEAMVMDPETAGLLQVEPGSAAFHLTHIFYDYQDQPVSWGGFICRGDKLQFFTKFGAALQSARTGRRTGGHHRA
jgi:GntR family transcriptional regulator